MQYYFIIYIVLLGFSNLKSLCSIFNYFNTPNQISKLSKRKLSERHTHCKSSRRWHEAHVEGRFRPTSHCTTLLATVAYNSLTTGSVQCKAYFPLGEFVCANRQKSRNACSRRIFSPANFNESCCRILVFASRRAKKVAKWKIGLSQPYIITSYVYCKQKWHHVK